MQDVITSEKKNGYANKTAAVSAPFPGIATTADGSEAIVWVDTHITQGACAYPITPSTNMGSGYEISVAAGKENLWGDKLFFLEPESEHSSASACEGYALAGGRVANFTSGQGLVLMKEVLYTISGKRLPVVFHIGARALTSHSLNVHAGHDDVMAVADCGWGMLFGKNAQEAADLALIARRTAEASHTPFMNIQDGFLTTHTIENVCLPEPELMREFIGAPSEKLKNLFDPSAPFATGVVQNQDSYMKGKIAQRWYTNHVITSLNEAFREYARLTGRQYAVVEPFMLDDAEYAIVGMGSAMETAMAAAAWLRRERGKKVGVLNVTAFRPFPALEIVHALRGCRAISVVERMDDPLAKDNPLTEEIKASFADAFTGILPVATEGIPKIYSGSYGLGGRDTRVADFIAAFDNMAGSNISGAEPSRSYFTLGIKHETALHRTVDPDVRPAGSFSMRGHSVGGYGSVTTNKVIASLVAEIFGSYVQAYPKYGSEKKGLPTTYYLTCAPEHILPHCELEHVEFVPMNDVNAFNLGNPLDGLNPNGAIFIQTDKTDTAEVWDAIPAHAKKTILDKNITVYFMDTVKVARESSSRTDLQQRMQGIILLGIFLRVAPFAQASGFDEAHLFAGVEKSLRKYFGKRGEQVVADNLNAVRRGYSEVMSISAEIMHAPSTRPATPEDSIQIIFHEN
jgi:pyruvate-ferredoxin/flavodoxin oxidoreductase